MGAVSSSPVASSVRVAMSGFLALAAFAVLTGSCGSSAPKAQPAPCGAALSSTLVAATELTAAARITASIHVSGQTASHPGCRPLAPGSDVDLLIGERVQFVANQPPQLDPPSSPVVAVSSSPGPAQSGPGGGGLRTTHLIVVLTAVKPGDVSVEWEDCSGTAC